MRCTSFLFSQSVTKFASSSQSATRLSEFVIHHAASSDSTPSFFSRATENPFLSVKQITPISPDKSDHKGFEINIGGHLKIICLNWMMKNNLHNNGFGNRVETRAMYLERMFHIANEFRELLSDENIVAFTGQEFAINPDDIASIIEKIKSFNIPGWCNPKMHITPFGVMTCFKNGAVKKAFHYDSDFTHALGSTLAERCQLFHTSESYSLVNVHVPYKDSENQFKYILQSLIEMKANCLNNQLSMIDFVGDKNLKPKIQRQLTRDIFEQLRAKRTSEGKKPFTLFSYVVPSREGHQKRIDEQPQYVSVDSAHRMMMHLSDDYAFHEAPYVIHPMEPAATVTLN